MGRYTLLEIVRLMQCPLQLLGSHCLKLLKLALFCGGFDALALATAISRE
jgi:hypothetical protein